MSQHPQGTVYLVGAGPGGLGSAADAVAAWADAPPDASATSRIEVSL